MGAMNARSFRRYSRFSIPGRAGQGGRGLTTIAASLRGRAPSKLTNPYAAAETAP